MPAAGHHLCDKAEQHSPLVASGRLPGEACVIVCQVEEMDLWAATPAVLQQVGTL